MVNTTNTEIREYTTTVLDGASAGVVVEYSDVDY